MCLTVQVDQRGQWIVNGKYMPANSEVLNSVNKDMRLTITSPFLTIAVEIQAVLVEQYSAPAY